MTDKPTTRSLLSEENETPRWKFQVLSPVDGKVLWELTTAKSSTVGQKWKEQTGNSYLSQAKVNRLTNGDTANPFIKVFRLNKLADRELRRREISLI